MEKNRQRSSWPSAEVRPAAASGWYRCTADRQSKRIEHSLSNGRFRVTARDQRQLWRRIPTGRCWPRLCENIVFEVNADAGCALISLLGNRRVGHAYEEIYSGRMQDAKHTVARIA